MMLAMAARPLHGAPLRPRLRRAPPSAAMVVASAKKLRRWRRRPSSVEDEAGTPAEGETHDDVSSAELDFLTALAAELTPSERGGGAPASSPPQTLLSSSSGGGGGAPLRGLDVLQALQHKAAARRKGGAGAGKGGTGQRRGARVGSGGGKGHEDVRDYSNVRPLDIKSDWGAHLDELDRLVQELQSQQHLYSD